LSEAIAALQKDVDALNETVYTGNGEPGLVSRMTKVETSVETLTKVAWLLVTCSATAVVGLVLDIAARHWK